MNLSFTGYQLKVSRRPNQLTIKPADKTFNFPITTCPKKPCMVRSPSFLNLFEQTVQFQKPNFLTGIQPIGFISPGLTRTLPPKRIPINFCAEFYRIFWWCKKSNKLLNIFIHLFSDKWRVKIWWCFTIYLTNGFFFLIWF